MMLLFLTTQIASANTDELAPQIKYWTNKVNSQVIVASQETDIFTELQKTLKENPTLPAIPEVIPKLGDFDSELERLRGKHNLSCVLFLKYDEGKNIALQEFGDCSVSKDLYFTVDEFQGKWDVYDQSNNIVPVDSFARVCNDYTLQARLEQENRYLKRNTKILRWSAGGLALASFIPLRNDSIGFTAKEEARLWSFVFLMGSASVLYFSRNIPTQKVQEEQSSLRNYYSRAEVERILAQRFPPPKEEITSEKDADGAEDAEQSNETSNETQEDSKQHLDNSNSSENTLTEDGRTNDAVESSKIEEAVDKHEEDVDDLPEKKISEETESIKTDEDPAKTDKISEEKEMPKTEQVPPNKLEDNSSKKENEQ